MINMYCLSVVPLPLKIISLTDLPCLIKAAEQGEDPWTNAEM